MNGIYVHIPFCKKKCGYCSFNSSTDFSFMPSYCDALIKEIKLRADKTGLYDSIYFGGGTPSVLPFGFFNKILNSVKENFNIAGNAEITMEVNPESCDRTLIERISGAGINRISLGLQSDNDELLKKIGRIHTYAQFISALETVLNAGIENVSADLMTGLPGQTLNGFEKTLENVSNLPLKHISVYSLSIEDGTPFHEAGITPDSDLQAQMYELCVRVLENKGYYRYEVSNFCRKGFMSRHNSKYWNLTPYLGLGLSAHSYIAAVYQSECSGLNQSFSATDSKRTIFRTESTKKNLVESLSKKSLIDTATHGLVNCYNTRIENTDSLIDYLSGKTIKKSSVISDKETIEEYIMLSLRTKEGLNMAFLKENFNYDILKEKKKQIKKLVKLKAVKVENDFLKVEYDAFYILNSIILELI